jgi:hypothetical protein
MNPKGTLPNLVRLLSIAVMLLPRYEPENYLLESLEVLTMQGKGSSLAIY